MKTIFKSGEESRELIDKRCYFLPCESAKDKNLPEGLTIKKFGPVVRKLFLLQTDIFNNHFLAIHKHIEKFEVV